MLKKKRQLLFKMSIFGTRIVKFEKKKKVYSLTISDLFFFNQFQWAGVQLSFVEIQHCLVTYYGQATSKSIENWQANFKIYLNLGALRLF